MHFQLDDAGHLATPSFINNFLSHTTINMRRVKIVWVGPKVDSKKTAPRAVLTFTLTTHRVFLPVSFQAMHSNL